MEEVRQLVQEEGREARNLIAFHVAVDTPAPSRVARKPPRAGLPPARRPAPRAATRLRSASAGRDKRSELRARYWALLFGDLQRAIGEIYNTVEAHENLNECQEVILVLENYTRDFKALGEWFRLKWEYDNTPPPQRPQSLAWEIRKTDFVRPESRRTHSVKSSPSVSGKNSPCLSGHNTPSGKNSPNLTGKASPGSGKISPRISGHPNTSPKGSVEFFSSKIASKIATKPEAKVGKDPRLSDIKEKDLKEVSEVNQTIENEKLIKDEGTGTAKHIVELGKAKELANAVPKPVIIKSAKRIQPNDDDKKKNTNDQLSSQAKATVAKLDEMENEFLVNHLNEVAGKNDNLLNKDKDVDKSADEKPSDLPSTDAAINQRSLTESPAKSEDNFADISNASSKSSDDKSTEHMNNGDIETSTNNISKSDANNLINNKINGDVLKTSSKMIENPEKHKKLIENTDTKNVVKTKYMKQNGKDLKAEINKTNVPDTKKSEQNKDLKKDSQSVKEVIKIVDAKDNKKSDQVKDFKKENQLNEVKSSIAENGDVTSAIKKPDPEDLKNDDLKKSDSNSNVIEHKDVDNKKEESKKVDTKPLLETKSVSKPAYSQAAAKPKPPLPKTEIKTPTKTALVRSKTVLEIRPNSAPKPRQFLNRSQKCSYPFNLTTGRTSLFDTPGNKVSTIKKPVSKTQMAAGDSKPQTKDIKHRPPRPASLKINEKGDEKEKINPGLEKLKDMDEYSSSDTVTQLDMFRIESSESLKTLVPENGHDVANSLEVLNVEGKNDNEGWLTVKSRRLSRESKKSKSHWSNRFHQPSATTSLPTLNMLESPKSEFNPIVNVDRAQSEQPQNKPEEAPKEPLKTEVIKVPLKTKTDKLRDTSMIRQKSDVTGLKTRSSRTKALKKDKSKDKKDCELTKNRLHSSLESLTTGLARSQESTENTFDFDKWKSEFKFNFKYLDDDDQISNHNEILRTADPFEMDEIAEMTSQIEENERKISLALDFQSELDQRKLSEEEDLLNRQIMELQQVSDVELDTETDDTETDAEILCEDTSITPTCQSTESLSLTVSLEDQYETALAGMSWAERVDTLGALEALVARDPGRAQQLHAKLSAGLKRRGSLQDALRRLQAKQSRADTQRETLARQRRQRIHALLARVEEVKMAKNQLIEEKRIRMERRLQKAAENRDQHLKDIVRKAHDEEEKLREIAFIKQLEAENRRHEFLDQCRSHTTRLREMRRERLDKLAAAAAREAAVGARRAALEAARCVRVAALVARRQQQHDRQQRELRLVSAARRHAARERAMGVRLRLSQMASAAQRGQDALRARIKDKQAATTDRRLHHIRTRANKHTTSESQDQGSKEEEEEEEATKLEQERKEREKQKAIRKKARKIKQKLLDTSRDSTVEPPKFVHPIALKMHKVVTQISNFISPLLSTDNDKPSQNGLDFEEDKKKKGKKKEIADNNNETQKGNKKESQNSNIDSQKGKNKTENTNDNIGYQKANNNTEQKGKNKKEIEHNSINETIGKTNNNIEEQKPKKKDKKESDNNIHEKGIINKEIENNNTDDQKSLKKESKCTDNSKKDMDDKGKNKNATDANNIEELETGKKKKKKKNDGQKLSKSNSICSSISDMSKGSVKVEKTSAPIDMPALEKLLNELHRLLSQEYRMPEHLTATKLFAIKTLGQLISIVAERDDLATQFTTKSITTAAVSISRIVCACVSAAAAFLHSAAATHTAVLLATTLEKDLQAEPKEMELAKHLTDCLSVVLDSVLCASRLQTPDGDKSVLTEKRARAHTLISYLCLSGCVARAENAGEVRESIQTLLTVCADLCHPCDADIGPELASATQSLRCALGTSLCGSRSEFCMLFAAGAELSRSGSFVRAARTAHLLRALAELDHQIVQEAFGEGGWPLEFRAAVARLLSQHAPNDKEAPRTTALRLSNQRLDQTLSETMVLDLIVLVGFVIVNNPQLHETICENWSVIKTLCTLPANWLVSPSHCHALLPTLIVLCERPNTSAVIASELSMKMLEEYMNSTEAQKVKLIHVLKQGKEKSKKLGKCKPQDTE